MNASANTSMLIAGMPATSLPLLAATQYSPVTDIGTLDKTAKKANAPMQSSIAFERTRERSPQWSASTQAIFRRKS